MAQSAHDQIMLLQQQMSGQIIGQQMVIRRILTSLLADGHVLIEGMPGLAKTRAINSLAKFLDAGLSRIQFTPDLLPSDITGTEIFQPDSRDRFVFQQGPVFNHLVLADEINRAPAKVQAALLEAMQERQVTVAGTTHRLPDLFLVMATQNPVDQEGTYPLPEAQMDRFLMHVYVDYPDADDEVQILRLVRGEESGSTAKTREVISQDVIFAARKEIQQLTFDDSIERYIVDIIQATRDPAPYDKTLAEKLDYGASPRGAIAIDKCCRVNAWLNGRDYVIPDDVQAVAHDCLRHRLVASYSASAEGITRDEILDELLKLVAV